jgi:hypothetical protein
MIEIKTNCYKDTKGVSEKVKKVDYGNECKTFEQREAKYLPYHKKVEGQVEQSRQVEGERQSTLHNSNWYDWAVQVHDNVCSMFSYAWEKKSTLLLGMMLASARGLGADAHLQHGSTALGLLDNGNTTGLPPAIDWRGFNPVNQTALPEFDPSRVPPSIADYLRKVGASESLIRKVERQNARRQLSELEQVKNPPARKLQDWTIPPNSLGCLTSVTDSIITSKTVPIYVNGKLLGKQTEISISSKVKNGCPKDVDNIQFHAKATGECNAASGVTTWDYPASPPLLHPTETADGGATDAGPPKVARCEIRNSKDIIMAIYPPRLLWVAITADGIMLDGRKTRPVHAGLYPKKYLSTCDDPCSNTPPSVDCIKECATTVSSNPSACLDVSASEVSGRVEPSVFGVPGQQVHLDLNLNVQNNCPHPIKDITFEVSVDRQCPSDHPFSSEEYALFYNANQNSADVGSFADAQNSTLAYCLRMKGLSTTVDSSSLPIALSVDISASGTDSTTNSTVSSQEKIFTVLGGSPWATNCDLHCPQPSRASSSHRLGTMQVLLRSLGMGIPLAYALAERFRW